MALRLLKRPLYLAGMLLDQGKVDAVVAGATKTTGSRVAGGTAIETGRCVPRRNSRDT